MILSDIPAADILETAADVLLDEGWTQGSARNPSTGGVCAHGAISRARSKVFDYRYCDVKVAEKESHAARMALTDYLGTTHPNGMPHIVAFNDDPNTTMFDVVDALRHAAKNLRNGEVTP